MILLQWVLVAFAALAAAWVCRKRPDLFWPAFIIAQLGTASLMIRGYCLIDEFMLLVFLITAAFLSKPGPRAPTRPWKRIEKVHGVLFLIMCGYMSVQAVRGAWLLEDYRVLRWGVFYGSLALLYLVLRYRSFPVPLGVRHYQSIVVCSGIYLLLYLAFGIVAEWTGRTRYENQGEDWSGTSYAVIPLIASVPASLLLLGEMGWKNKVLAAGLIFIGLGTGAYYESRSSLFAITGLVLSSLIALGWRQWILALGILLVGYVGFWHIPRAEHVQDTLGIEKALAESAGAIVAPRSSDQDRQIQLEAAMKIHIADPWSAILGYGTHQHRKVLVPYLESMMKDRMPGQLPGKIARTTCITAILVDSGIVGIGLIALNLIFAAWSTWAGTRSMRGVFVMSCLPQALAWMFISNIQDIVLIYLFMMPQGLLLILKPDDDTQKNFVPTEMTSPSWVERPVT